MSIVSRITTGLTDWEWDKEWLRVTSPMAKRAAFFQIPIPTFEEWRDAVVAEGANRQFIHRAFGERISLRRGVLEVIDELRNFDPAETAAKMIVPVYDGKKP